MLLKIGQDWHHELYEINATLKGDHESLNTIAPITLNPFSQLVPLAEFHTVNGKLQTQQWTDREIPQTLLSPLMLLLLLRDLTVR